VENTKLDDAYMRIVNDTRIYQDSFEESVSIILCQCQKAMAISRVSLWLISDDQQELNCVSLYLGKEKQFQSGLVISADTFPRYFEALLNSRFIDANDTFADPRTAELGPSYLKKLNVKSLLDSTIRHDGQVQGVLCMEMIDVKRDWKAEEKTFAASMADLISQRLVANKLSLTQGRYQSLFESTSEAILIFGENGFEDVNPAACSLFGGSKKEIMSKSPPDLSPKYQSDGELTMTKASRYISDCYKGKDSSKNFEWLHRRLDGTEFQAEVTMNIINFEGRDTVCVLTRDITEKKESEQLAIQNFQLELAKKEAEAAAKSKMNFLANMSHEIRTPMNGIFGMVNLVLDTPLNNEQKDYIETIQSSTNSLLNILNEVLEYSRLSNSAIVLDKQEFDLNRLVRDVLRSFKALAEEKHLSLKSSIDTDIPIKLMGDDHRIRQILVNLVGNAIKFTREGLVKVSVEYNGDSGAKHNIIFSVSDTGIGIDEATLGKLFQPFTQADSSITRNYGGSGLGLAICRDLVELMDGEISVESEVGKGSVFSFNLCLEAPDHEGIHVETLPLSGTAPLTIKSLGNGQSFPNHPILLVEDNLINQKVTKSIIEKLGYPVSIANNGQEAVELCEQNDYSIVFMDLSMPEMDGFEATEIIRSKESEGSEVTIIAVTGHSFLEHRQRCEEVGINDFLSKPFDLFKLKEKLDSYTVGLQAQ